MDTVSIVMGAPLSAEPFLGALTIPDYLREVTARFGPREALVMRNGKETVSWSYAQLWERSVELGRALLAAGVGKDSRVGLLMSNRPEFLAATFGVALAGGVTVVLSSFSTGPELEHLLRVSGVSILLYEPRVAKKDFDAILLELEPALATAGPLWSARFPYLRRLVRLELDSAPDLGMSALQSWSGFVRGAAVLRSRRRMSGMSRLHMGLLKPSQSSLHVPTSNQAREGSTFRVPCCRETL